MFQRLPTLRPILILCAFFSFLAMPLQAGDKFANPLDVLIADPHVMKDVSTYYLYGTTGLNSFETWSSQDMVNWTYGGVVWQATGSSWGKNRFWAPEVIKHNGNYYLLYSAGGSPNNVMRICVAASSSPLGPFTDIAAPLFDNGQSYIDGHVFVDHGGQTYLYLSQDMSYPADNKSETYVVPITLSPTAASITGTPTLCITPNVAWEIAPDGFRWNEAPAVLSHGGFYYMLYSGNLYASNDYAVGYATANHPLGPWTKYAGNPILKKTPGVSGPGHCSIVPSPVATELWLAYHTHQQPAGGNARHLAIDRIAFSAPPSGMPVLSVPGGPSTNLQDPPSGAPAFPLGGDDEFNGSTLDRTKWTVFNENPGNISVGGGSLNMVIEQGDINGGYSDMKNILLQYPPYEDFRITAELNFDPQANVEMAFLTVWQDHNNYIRFADMFVFGHAFEYGTEQNSTFTGGGFFWKNTPAEKTLRIDKIGDNYSCYYRTSTTDWEQIGPTKQLDFTDIKVGFGGSSLGSAGGRIAQFKSFQVESLVSSVNDWGLYE